MLKMEHVRKNYESFSLNCSLEVKSGYVTGLIGKNGAGKSTVFKMILGLIAKDSGTIRLFDKEIQTLNDKEKQQLGVVLSDSGFSGYLTIHDIIPILDHLYEHFDKSFFVKQIQRFRLPQNQKIKEFSTGMKAKLKILTAISHHAKFLLLDEPTAGLDVTARDELLDMLREFMEQDESRSILISPLISQDNGRFIRSIPLYLSPFQCQASFPLNRYQAFCSRYEQTWIINDNACLGQVFRCQDFYGSLRYPDFNGAGTRLAVRKPQGKRFCNYQIFWQNCYAVSPH